MRRIDYLLFICLWFFIFNCRGQTTSFPGLQAGEVAYGNAPDLRCVLKPDGTVIGLSGGGRLPIAWATKCGPLPFDIPELRDKIVHYCERHPQSSAVRITFEDSDWLTVAAGVNTGQLCQSKWRSGWEQRASRVPNLRTGGGFRGDRTAPILGSVTDRILSCKVNDGRVWVEISTGGTSKTYKYPWDENTVAQCDGSGNPVEDPPKPKPPPVVRPDPPAEKGCSGSACGYTRIVSVGKCTGFRNTHSEKFIRINFSLVGIGGQSWTLEPQESRPIVTLGGGCGGWFKNFDSNFE
jgi:hypothetical protein